jgi:hypothetical protein
LSQNQVVAVSFKNNYWDNRSAADLQASILDAEDDIKLAVVIGTEPQLRKKPTMKVAENPLIALPVLPSMPHAIQQLTTDKGVPSWVFKAVGILLVSFVIQYLVKKI